MLKDERKHFKKINQIVYKSKNFDALFCGITNQLKKDHDSF
jgi:hypothetical protein